MWILGIVLVAMVVYAFSGEKKKMSTVSEHAHSSGFVILACLVALVVFVIVLGTHVPSP